MAKKRRVIDRRPIWSTIFKFREALVEINQQNSAARAGKIHFAQARSYGATVYQYFYH
jgi:hypothetical protein